MELVKWDYLIFIVILLTVKIVHSAAKPAKFNHRQQILVFTAILVRQAILLLQRAAFKFQLLKLAKMDII